jgi:hypothetical protein
MDSIKGKPKKFESVVGLFLLAVLTIITITILITQSDYDMTRFGVGTAASAPGMEKISLTSLAPAGFETLSEEAYLADNLYEKINGKSPLYIESGFVKLSTARFVSKDDEGLWMELFIFDMASIKNAFSVYSVQRRPSVEILPDIQFGYRTADAPYLVHGKYYIEFIASSKSDVLFKAMMETAQKIKANLPIDVDTEIPELSYFPQDNLVPGSHKLYLESAFGFEGFSDILTAQYKFGDQTITAFLSRRPDPQEARLVAKSYHKFLIENGGAAKPAITKILKGKVVDFYETTEIISAIGPFVVGIHEAENQQYAEKLATILINKLSEAMSND